MAHGMMKPKASPMMDKAPARKTPKAGEDFDPKKRIAGSEKMPDRDGPAKREADPKPKKPSTSEKTSPSTAVSQGIKAQSGMPSNMPTMAQMSSMKKSIKGMSGGFKR